MEHEKIDPASTTDEREHEEKTARPRLRVEIPQLKAGLYPVCVCGPTCENPHGCCH